MIRGRDMGCSSGMMAGSILVSGRVASNMELVLILGKMEKKEEESGKMERRLDGLIEITFLQ